MWYPGGLESNGPIELLMFLFCREIYPLTTSSTEDLQPFLLHADWAPRGHALMMVHDYDIYYRPAPRSARAFRITDSAIPGVISNGVPDWLYEGTSQTVVIDAGPKPAFPGT